MLGGHERHRATPRWNFENGDSICGLSHQNALRAEVFSLSPTPKNLKVNVFGTRRVNESRLKRGNYSSVQKN